MQSLSFAASPRGQSEEQFPAFGLGQLEEMMKIADPVCFGSFILSIDPTQLFELTFAKNYEKLVANLNTLTKQSLSEIQISDWSDLNRGDSENVSSFKRRTVKISRRNASPWAWVNNKPVESLSQQYSVHREKGWTVYCISQGFERRAIRVIEKFHVEVLNPPNTSEGGVLSPRRNRDSQRPKERTRVRVGVSASAHYSDGIPPSFVAFTKATSSCRFQFGKWKQLVLEMVDGRSDTESSSVVVSESGVHLGGKWNKLSSYDQIHLLPDQNRLVHFDGHSFPFRITNQTEKETTVAAQYGDRTFSGIVYHDVPDEIKWSNGSVWIKDGFCPFVGAYQAGDKKMEFHDTGEIIGSDGTHFHVSLCGRNEIEKTSAGRCRHFAEHVDGKLIWNTDEVWIRLASEKRDESTSEEKKSQPEVGDDSNDKKMCYKPKVPRTIAPPVPIAVPSEGIARAVDTDDMGSLFVRASPIENVIEGSDDEEPSASGSYSLSVEKISYHDLDRTEEFEGWLVVDEYL